MSCVNIGADTEQMLVHELLILQIRTRVHANDFILIYIHVFEFMFLKYVEEYHCRYNFKYLSLWQVLFWCILIGRQQLKTLSFRFFCRMCMHTKSAI